MREEITLFIVITGLAFFSLNLPESAFAISHPFILEWGESGLSSDGKFSFPQNLALDDSGNVYVTDLGNKRVQKFDNDGNFLKNWGGSGSGTGQFHSPAGIAVFNGSVYVVDSQLNRVQEFDLSGNFVKMWGSRGDASGQFLIPNGIETDVNGTIYVVDTGNHRIQKFTPDGEFLSQIGSSGPSNEHLLTPIGIAIGPDNSIFVSEPSSNKIKKFDTDGNFVKYFGPNVAGFEITPLGMATDPNGNLYVADNGNNRIIQLDENGLAITAWGSMGIESGQFKFPKDVQMDKNGNVFVVDSYGHRIQKFGSPTSEQIAFQQVSAETVEAQSSSSSSSTQTNAVSGDLTKPTIIAPNDLTIEATGGLTPVSVGQAMANDESGIESLTSNAPEKFPLGVTTIIWTAIDGAGNMGIATQKISVVDTVAPSIEKPKDVRIEAKNPSSNHIELGEPKTEDAVGVISITNDAPEVFAIGETMVTWTVTDVAGNVAEATQRVEVVDSTAPELTIPSDVLVEATSFDKNEVFLGEPTVVDNGEIISISNDSPPFFGLGNTTVTWTASDASGNTATKKQLVTVLDKTPPKLEMTPTISFEATSETSNSVNLIAPNYTDIQNVTITNNAPVEFPIGETEIVWNAVDGSGNNSTVNQTIEIVDTTPPTVQIPQDITIEATSPEENHVDLGELTAEDISGISSVVTDAPELFPFGITNVTWTVTDNHGNSATSIQTVNVIDTTPPSISSPPDIIAEASDFTQNYVELGEPEVSDIIGIKNITNDAPEFFPIGMTTVTWTVTDTSGNTASSSQTVTLEDTTPPTIIPPANITEEATSPSGISLDIGQATASDLIGNLTITNDSPDEFFLGDTIVTWTATDSHGNTAMANQTISLVDTTAPSIEPPEDVVFEAEHPNSNQVEIGLAQAEDAVEIVLLENDAPSSFPLGETLVTWTASDSSGNIATATQRISVVDTTAPTITPPDDVVVEATSSSENIVDLGEPLVDDAIGIESITNDAPEFFPVGNTEITWAVTDSSGLSANATQLVEVVDTTPPTMVVPEIITVEATSEKQNFVDFGKITTNDLVGVASVSSDAPEVFPLGLTTITWTATDESGNTATAQQKVSIVDTTPPTISVPDDVTVEAENYDANIVELGNAKATDEVAVKSITNDAPEQFALGETIVTWFAVDTSENSVNATQKVTIVDTTPPTIIAPEDIVSEATSSVNNTVTLVAPNSEDSVGSVEITSDAPEVFPLGLTTITWTATDESGNTATAQQKVSIVDTTPPTISVPDDVISEVSSPHENQVDLGVAEADDLVEVSSITNDAPEFFPYGETTVTWSAVDSSGNSISGTQLVKIVDTTEPTIVAPQNVIFEATGPNENEVDIGMASSSDIMEVVSVTNDSPEHFAIGDTFVTWTATDEAGNSANDVQKITVVDTTPPSLDVPDDVIFDAAALQNSVEIGMAAASDLVDETPEITNDAPELFPLGNSVVTWTATDKFGNSANSTQTIEVQACGRPVSYYNQIMGTPQDDILSGTDVADLIFGFEGNDIITGAKGNDCIFAGEGDDIVFGNEGNDTLMGGEGNDVIKGQSGEDSIEGGGGTDIIDGGDDNDSCSVQAPSQDDLIAKCEN